MVVRLVLWNLADSLTNVGELRRYLRDESVEQSRARELIGKEPEITEVFDLEATVSTASEAHAPRARVRRGDLTGALRVEWTGAALRIALARPERRNAFDASLIAELTEAFADAGDARAVVLSGDGPSFSAGADVEWMRSSVDLSYEDNVADRCGCTRCWTRSTAARHRSLRVCRVTRSAAAAVSSPAATSRSRSRRRSSASAR